MTIFDAHSHVVPVDLYARRRSDDPRWPTMELESDEWCNVFTKGRLYRRIRATTWDMERRLVDLAERGVDRQVVSPMPYLMMSWLPGRDAAAYCDDLNSAVGALAASTSNLYGLATLPLQHIDAATSAIRNGFPERVVGVQVGTSVDGVSIADPRFVPVWSALAERGVPVFVHAVKGPCAFECPPDLRSAIEFPSEVGTAVASLLAGGLFDVAPALRLLASHGAGTLATLLPRMSHAWNSKRGQPGMPAVDPLEEARRLFVDSLTFSPDVLDHVVQVLGEQGLVIGSDYPFLNREIGDTVRGGPLSSPGWQDRLASNAERWLGGDLDAPK